MKGTIVPAPRRPVMLSFDDGPRPGTTERVLDALAARGGLDGWPLRAAFFTLAENPAGWFARRRLFAPYEVWTDKGSMAAHPELTRQIVAEGHCLGNHGGRHFWPRWPWFRRGDRVMALLREWERTVERVVPDMATDVASGGSCEPIARAPYLLRTPAWREAVSRAGYRDVAGITSGDADPRADGDQVRETLLARLSRAEQADSDPARPIVLIFHDTRPLTAECLPAWLEAIEAAGHPLLDFDPSRC
ncbi:polysaccharide deacetylase family protein [Guyparkeria sp.]|uniref:polysaccharide deacetylase family protein n=1 Tax=Guyparkeria sp. TaxID=2035736 RepID=UPI003970B0E9